MDHPFQVGEHYSNRSGRYEVLAIEESKMLVRFEDGREIRLTIELQAQIWAFIQQDKQSPVKPKKRKATQPRAKRLGSKSSGLIETDFKSNVTGTVWRRREGLGGLLAQQMSDTTPYQFQSHAIYRRPSVYVTLPGYYDPKNGLPYAKFELRLSSEGAQYGFYVERDDGSKKMDGTWHWHPFLKAIETDITLQQNLLKTMQENNFQWLIQIEESEGADYSVENDISVKVGSPLLWEAEDIDWPGFANRLRDFPPDKWLNVHLCRWSEKGDVIESGVQFADKVSKSFQSILPLYLSCVGK